jgi:osmotically-inducible protein OsmY
MAADAPEYLVERVREALAEDERVGQLDVQVSIAGDRLLLDGIVATEERREAATEIAKRVCPDLEVINALDIERLRHIESMEDIG